MLRNLEVDPDSLSPAPWTFKPSLLASSSLSIYVGLHFSFV